MPGEDFETTLPAWFLISAVFVIVNVHNVTRWRFRRVAGYFFILLIGGMGFEMLFFGRSTWKDFLMHHSAMPLAVFVIALLCDGMFYALVAGLGLRPDGDQLPGRWQRGAFMIAALVCALLLGGAFFRNVDYLLDDIDWNKARNRNFDSDNLVSRSLYARSWSDSPEHVFRNVYPPVSGMQVSQPPGWRTDFLFEGETPVHYEIWWLEPLPMSRLRLLLNAAHVDDAQKNCRIRLFDGVSFQSLPQGTVVTKAPFVAGENEPTPETPGAWLEYELHPTSVTRALRLSCIGKKGIALRQIESYEK